MGGRAESVLYCGHMSPTASSAPQCLICHADVPAVEGRAPLQCDECRAMGGRSSDGGPAVTWAYGPAPRLSAPRNKGTNVPMAGRPAPRAAAEGHGRDPERREERQIPVMRDVGDSAWHPTRTAVTPEVPATPARPQKKTSRSRKPKYGRQ